ncbi:DUF488 domain-containing protein [Luteimonas pelagia]
MSEPTPRTGCGVVHTIGHSNRSLEAFLALLAASGIQCVVDVRRLPGSRTFPWFDAERLVPALAVEGIDYWHPEGFRGRRTRSELDGAPPEPFWSNASFARFAAHARGEAFQNDLATLMARSRGERCALMCSEAVWWRCHRRIIADHLLARGCEVRHILGPGQVATGTPTRGARLADGTVHYPA